MNRSPPNTEPRAGGTQDLSRLVGVKLGNYRLEKLIGRGRMGVVYLAKDEALLRPTAVKVLAWSAEEAKGQDPVQWFLAEARLVARINDPRVVQIYGAARQGDFCYIAMEYVQGQSTEALMAAGRVRPEVATDILLQAASALNAAHRSGVVHRDVKPANLLIGPGGITKLGDFGMAHGLAGIRVGQAQVRAGTPFYTAPEIWRGGGASAASDIYALGATYFHLLTGRPPFDGPDVAAVEQAHLTAPVPDPRALVPGLPASCVHLVQRALAKVPAERHPSAQVLMWEGRRALQDLVDGSGARATPEALTPAPRPGGGNGQGSSRPGASRPVPPLRPPEPPPARSLSDVLGFVRRPFVPVEASDAPFNAEPLASIRRRIARGLEEDAAAVFLLTGPRGSGRTTLLKQLAAEVSPSRRVLYLDVRAAHDGRTLVQRLERLAGTVEEGTEPMAGLLRQLDEERKADRRGAPLIILDGVVTPHPSTAGLATVVGAALWTRSFRLVMAGDPGLAQSLVKTGIDFRDQLPVEVAIPPLDHDQVAHYVRCWVRACLPPGAKEPIFTPDAFLLLTRRSEGVLERINVLAANMLLLASSERRRTLTSWHAWVSNEKERWPDIRPPPPQPPRTGPWPPPEVADVIDACRRVAGLPPWPRGEAG